MLYNSLTESNRINSNFYTSLAASDAKIMYHSCLGTELPEKKCSDENLIRIG